MHYYILDGHRAIVAPDLLSWAEWFQTADRIVAQTRVGDALVSTVFLGLDHNFGTGGDPLLFETLVFLDEDWSTGAMRRYFLWAEADAGHAELVAELLAEMATAEGNVKAALERIRDSIPR